MTQLDILKQLKIEFPEISTLNASTIQERYFKIHYPELHKYIIEHTNTDYKWSEKLYTIYKNILARPKCPTCGNECKFCNFKTGYSHYCSNACVSKSDIIKNKKIETAIKKYGVSNPMQSSIVKEKIKQTNLEKYGVENVYQSSIVKEKIKQTNLEKYGVEYALQNDEIKQRLKNTCLEKYGVEYISQSKVFKDICKNNSLEKYGVTHPMKSEYVKQNVRKNHKEKYGVEYISQRPEVIDKIANSLRKNHMKRDPNIIGFTEEHDLIVKCPHNECNKCVEKYFTIPTGIYYDRQKINAELCTKLLPIKSSISTYEIQLRKILDNNGIEYETNVRNVISNELDIFVPSKNIAIEFNGIFWHCNKNKDSKYHINKFNECKEKGIQLITIWEDQYINSPKICESLLLHKLGITYNKVFARKCNIHKVKSNIAQDFYVNNHIQGRCGASVHYALQYDNEIVAMMSFGKRKMGNNDVEWELIRYCSKLYYTVVGGASRLLKTFINEYKPELLISWSSNDISDGNMYKKLGFEYSNTSNSYWYIKNRKRYHRSGFNKSNLIKKGIVSECDTRSESQIMNANGFLKIHDTGQTKWIKKCYY